MYFKETQQVSKWQNSQRVQRELHWIRWSTKEYISRHCIFFLKGKMEDHVIRILDACGFAATSRIKDLKDKALTKQNNTNAWLAATNGFGDSTSSM